MAAPANAAAAGQTRTRAFRIGFALAVANIITGAAQPVLTRYGAVRLDPLLFCTGNIVFATVCTVALLYFRGELAPVFERRRLALMIVMSLVGTGMTGLTLTYGLNRIGAVAGVLLLQTEPVYSLCLATIFAGERPSKRQLMATAAILVGIASVFGAGGAFAPLWAAALVFVTPLFWQTSHVMGLRLMPPMTPLQISAARFVYAGFAMVPAVIILRPETLVQLADPKLMGVILLTGFFVYFISALTWYGAINRLSLAWTTSLVVPGVPLLSVVFSMIFLGEHATFRELIGIAISVTGVIALVLGSDPHRKPPAGEAAEAIHEPLA
ncbi:MAG: DMT family transporter [Candidatus Binataceae bacterium]